MSSAPRAAFLVLVLLPACAEETSRRGGDGAVAADSGDAGGTLDQIAGADGQRDQLPGVDVAGSDLQPDAQADASATSEILLYDGDNLQFTVADNGFHALIQPGDPLPASDWLAPHDYYNGELQIRYVINSPANQVAGKLQTCIWTMGNGDGDGKNYFPESCSAQVAHTGPGEYYNTNLDPASWWKKDGVPLDFTHPEWFLIRVVLRGTSGCNVTTYNVANACWNEWPSYQDMKFRVTIVMVGAGDTFSGWQSYP